MSWSLRLCTTLRSTYLRSAKGVKSSSPILLRMFMHYLSYGRLYVLWISLQVPKGVVASAFAILVLNLSNLMSRCVYIVSQPKSRVQVSLAVLLGVARSCLAATRCKMSSSLTRSFQALGI